MQIEDMSRSQASRMIDTIISQYGSCLLYTSVPEKEDGQVLYPGEPELIAIRDNRENGIPVVEEKWNEVLAM